MSISSAQHRSSSINVEDVDKPELALANALQNVNEFELVREGVVGVTVYVRVELGSMSMR
eukprot:2167767-Amphidinium_carterae.3